MMMYVLAVLCPPLALWIDRQRISALVNMALSGVSAYYALTLPQPALLLAAPAHALVLVHLTSATRFGRRQASRPSLPAVIARRRSGRREKAG